MLLLLLAEKVPEEYYSFRPTEAVRTFGQIVGHIADAQYANCSTVLGEKDPNPKIETTKTSKADLIVALKDALAYCGRAYNSMTDASATQMARFSSPLGPVPIPKLSVMTINMGHNQLHYGNLVTGGALSSVVGEQRQSRPWRGDAKAVTRLTHTGRGARVPRRVPIE